MARRKKEQEQPVESNRGRADARGVFVIFERDEESEATERNARPAKDGDADEALTRDRPDGGSRRTTDGGPPRAR